MLAVKVVRLGVNVAGMVFAVTVTDPHMGFVPASNTAENVRMESEALAKMKQASKWRGPPTSTAPVENARL